MVLSNKSSVEKFLQYMKNSYVLYLFLLPAVAYIFIFNYIPMYGVQIAFKNFKAARGIWGSPWVGLVNFQKFLSSPDIWNILGNTVGISLYSLIVGFPVPIILALMLNYIRPLSLKKTIQTVSYAPFFISTVVIAGLLYLLLSPNAGVLNSFRKSFGLDSVFFLAQPNLFKTIYVLANVWQNAGWGSIIYIAALSGVSQELHEAAISDGATKLQRIWHIDLPSIQPTIIILLILRIGQIMNVGFEMTYLLQNPMNINSSEVIATYVYKVGLLNIQYGYAAAVGLFNNVINLAFLVFANRIAKKVTESSLW
ncbi:MAG: ABC transporter permease subunit [Treponema sp.]|nr:ABC transporter permease subunit [Treponema sp.]